MTAPEQPWDKYINADPSVVEARDAQHEENQEALKVTLAAQDVASVLTEETGQGLLWPRPAHVQCNWLLTSAVFQAARRSVPIDALVATQGPVRFALKGWTLTQFDEIVWMELLQRMKEQRSTSVALTLRSFTKSLGITGGGENIKRIRASIERMNALSIVMMVDDKTAHGGYGGSLVHDYEWVNDDYRVYLNPVWVRLLFREGYTRVDWATHTSLPVGFATWLHRYTQRHTATKKKPHRIAVRSLRALLGTSMSLRDSRRGIRRAMAALTERGAVSGWEIDKADNLVFWRPLSKKQKNEAVLKKIGARLPIKEKSPQKRIKEQLPNSGQRELFEF